MEIKDKNIGKATEAETLLEVIQKQEQKVYELYSEVN